MFNVLQTVKHRIEKSENRNPDGPDEREIVCYGERSALVMRDKSDKWYVSPEEYADKKYPPYCLGFIMFITGESIGPLFKMALREKYFWIDDLWLTGFVAPKANVSVVIDRETIYERYDEWKFSIRENAIASFGGLVDRKIDQITRIWSHLALLYANQTEIMKYIGFSSNPHVWSDFSCMWYQSGCYEMLTPLVKTTTRRPRRRFRNKFRKL